MSRQLTAWLLAVVATVAVTGCDGAPPSGPDPTTSSVPGELAPALSEPVEDSYYPDVGDPGVDALHYDLDLTWRPEQRQLEATATIVFRSTRDDAGFRLDLAAPLEVATVTLDGKDTDFDHEDKNLLVRAPVHEDETHTAVITYAGTPAPVEAPTTRSDFSTVGFTVDPEGRAWTMQEPFGAYTWYPVNDQPSDKAFYDFTIHAPRDWVGIANGRLVSRTVTAGQTVTRFHLDQPAASYLVTLAIGDYGSRSSTSRSGVPITVWALRGQRTVFRRLRAVGPALDWIETKLGPYPFDTAGAVVVDSRSAMETQSLVTLGDREYDLSREVIVHELVHQWYGDLVTPTDWRDLWMNEGMTTYLQMVYRAETTGTSLDRLMASLSGYDAFNSAGPPGAYDRDMFGETNVYYRPARMWHALRQRVGDDAFWGLARDWPREHAASNATREDWFSWIEDETGEDLTDFFADWLLAKRAPD